MSKEEIEKLKERIKVINAKNATLQRTNNSLMRELGDIRDAIRNINKRRSYDFYQIEYYSKNVQGVLNQTKYSHLVRSWNANEAIESLLSQLKYPDSLIIIKISNLDKESLVE